jgi:hypothetical protein
VALHPYSAHDLTRMTFVFMFKLKVLLSVSLCFLLVAVDKLSSFLY